MTTHREGVSGRTRKAAFVTALLLAGCAGNGSTQPPEFILYDVPSKSLAANQGIDVYKVIGHGRTCYIAAFGISKVLLWCEP